VERNDATRPDGDNDDQVINSRSVVTSVDKGPRGTTEQRKVVAVEHGMIDLAPMRCV